MTFKKIFAGAHHHLGWTAASSLISLLVALPILVLFYYLFAPGGEVWEHLRATTLPGYIGNSLALMGLVALFASLLGIPTAWLVAATEFPGRRVLSWLLVLPLAAPAYVIAYLYTDLLDFAGPVQSWLRSTFDLSAGDYWFPSIRNITGAALLLSLVLYPYVYLLARAAFSARAGVHFEAARALGKSPFIAFFRVALPAARPAVAGGLALVLMETLADFGVVDYFSIPTFSTGIFRTWISMGEKEAAMKLASVMLLFVIALVAFESLSRRGRFDSGTNHGKMTPMTLTGSKASLAAFVCALPVLFGFIIPVLTLTGYTLSGGDQMLGRGFSGYVTNTLSVASVAAIIATLLALLLAYTQRLTNNPITAATIRISTLGYALPGLLLAIGLLGPVTGYDRALTGYMAETFGWSGGLVLTGTTVLLVYAYVIRFLTVSFNTVSGGLQAISPSMDAAARSLGSTPFGVIRRIHLPLLRPSLAIATLLVFVDVVRELPATLILRPFNFETLATRVYRLASDERLAEASTAAITIVLVGLIPVLLLDRLGNRH